MLPRTALVINSLLLFTVHGEALTFSRSGRYIPNIKVAEEIDISDVTFTTPATDAEHLASLTTAKLTSNHGRTKPRVVVPVMTYHKVNHPSPEFLGPPADSTVKYEKRNFGIPDKFKSHKSKKWKFFPHGKGHADLIFAGHHGGGPKKVFPPSKYKLPGFPPRSVRPVYYLVGDDPATKSEGGDYDGGITSPGKYVENVKLYHEKELQFVKPNKKNPYPKKYFPSSVKKYNHKIKQEGYGGSEDEEALTLENSETTQTVGQSGDQRLSKGGDRVEFQMYGMDGPNSYKFGYDTGKGDNRHFRFEERDSDGKIRGHYGYMDNEGKMRIMKYEADPETGFHAGPVDLPSEEESK